MMKSGSRLLNDRSRQQVGHGNLADPFAVQHERNPVAWPEHLACSVEPPITVSSGLRQNFDLPFDEIDNPVDGNSCRRVDALLPTPIPLERSRGHFDHQTDLLGDRMPIQQLGRIAANHADESGRWPVATVMDMDSLAALTKPGLAPGTLVEGGKPSEGACPGFVRAF